MKNRLLLSVLAVMMAVTTAMAVPVKPGLKKKVTLDDGTTVELTMRGDEFYTFYTDDNGQAYQLNDGKLLSLTSEEVTRKWTAIKRNRQAVKGIPGRAPRRTIGEPGITTGDHRGLVILVQFQDVKFVTPNPQETYWHFFNDENYHDNGMTGSVHDYFIKQSYGKFILNFDVVGPYTISRETAYYGAHGVHDGVEANDMHPAEMVREGVDAAEADGVDFSLYDWDKDGEVEQVFVVYAGYSEGEDSTPETIWPHKWMLQGENVAVRYDDVWMNIYACASELSGSNNPNSKFYKPEQVISGIGPACHEFSHCLGLPDMYNTRGSSYGMISWDVMDTGVYQDDSRTPAGYTAYERWFAGWLEPVELNELTTITDMKPLATHPEAYVLYNEGTEKNIKGEYYLLENRQRVDFDSKLDGHGLLIVHVDYDQDAWQTNTVNGDASHQRVAPIAANGRYTRDILDVSGDPWPGSFGNTMLGRNTTPAATLYNENKDGTYFLNKTIDSITEDTKSMTVSFVACRQELDVPEIDKAEEQAEGSSVTLSWPAVSGAVGYELEIIEKNKKPHGEYTFDECYSETENEVEISQSLDDYGLAYWDGWNLYTSPLKLRIGNALNSGLVATGGIGLLAPTNLTLVVGMDTGGEDDTVKGYIVLQGFNAETRRWQDVLYRSFSVTGAETLTYNFKDVGSAAFRYIFYPDEMIYMNYLANYAKVSINNSETSTNSYTLNNLNEDKTYSYRLRAIGESGPASVWSAEKTVNLETTGVQGIISGAADDGSVCYYDLQGRKVTPTTKGLLIRKQGNNIRKYIK